MKEQFNRNGCSEVRKLARKESIKTSTNYEAHQEGASVELFVRTELTKTFTSDEQTAVQFSKQIRPTSTYGRMWIAHVADVVRKQRRQSQL